MGIDFVAIIPHRLDVAGLRAVLPEFDRLNHDIVAWWPSSLSGIRGRAWTFNPLLDAPWAIQAEDAEAEQLWMAGRGVWVCGSRESSFLFNRHALTVFGPGDRWRQFCEHAEHRRFVRRVFRAIARIFRADRAVYVPDAYLRASEAMGMIHSGATVEEAQAWLVEHCGPPAASAGEIVLRDDEQTGGTYFVDRFVDLTGEV